MTSAVLVAAARHHILCDQVPLVPYEKLHCHHLPVHTFVDNVPILPLFAPVFLVETVLRIRSNTLVSV